MIEPYLESFERFAANGASQAPDAIRSLRLSAITRFEALGFPTTRNEDWHFTSVSPIDASVTALVKYAPPPMPAKLSMTVAFEDRSSTMRLRGLAAPCVAAASLTKSR